MLSITGSDPLEGRAGGGELPSIYREVESWDIPGPVFNEGGTLLSMASAVHLTLGHMSWVSSLRMEEGGKQDLT